MAQRRFLFEAEVDAPAGVARSRFQFRPGVGPGRERTETASLMVDFFSPALSRCIWRGDGAYPAAVMPAE
jgi:hypothetical protein